MLRPHRPELVSSFAESGRSLKIPPRRNQLLAEACDKVIDGLQSLEPRIMLASAAGNVVARFDGSLPTAGATQQMLLHVTPTIFSRTRTGGTILGFQLSNADGGTLDPAIVQIQSVATGVSPAASIAPLYTKADLANNTQSLALANLPYGDYMITIAGDRNTLGNWHLDVYLAGDASRSHTVDATDTALLKSIYGTTSTDPTYLVEADADLNGQIDSTDTALELRNIGAAVQISALTLTAALSPAPTAGLADGTPLTNQSAISVKGLTTPRTTVSLDLHGGTTFGDGSMIAAPDGSYSIPLTLSEGLNTLRLRATDLFGQSMQATLKVSLDDIAPPVTLTLDTASDTAPAGDNHTTLSTVELDGQTEPNTPVTLLQENLTTTSDSAGRFSFTGVSLAIGDDGFTASATDAAGNVGNGNLTVTRDALPPHITSTAPLTALIGVLYTYNVTATDPQGSLLTYSLPTAPANMVIDPATGKITWTPTAVQAGSQSVTVRAANAFGVFDSQSFSVNVAAALRLTAALSPLSTLSLPDGTPLTAVKNIRIVGVTSPGATVKLDTHGGTAFGDGTTIAANDGSYSFSLVLTEGLNNFNIQATDTFGQTQTASLKVSLDDIAPIVTLTLDPASVSILGGNHTALSAVTLDGVTEPNLIVTLAQSNLTTTADGNGKFSFANVPVMVGNNPFSAAATDTAGNTGTGTLTVIGDAAAQTLVEGTHFHVVYQQTISIPATPSVLQFTFSGLNFDTAAHFVKDAFEASLIGTDGTSDAFTIGTGHEAFFNVTEGQATALAKGVSLNGQTVSVDLSPIPAGHTTTLVIRLVNDDSDTTTAVTISNVHVVGGGLPTGGTVGPVGVLPPPATGSGRPINPSNPTATVISTGTTGNGPAIGTTHGPSVPSTTMALTAAGKAAGFTLTTFVTGFHDSIGFGPVGVGFFNNGNVAVSDAFFTVRILPNDNDGQSTGSAIAVQNVYPDSDGMATVGQHVYMAQGANGNVVELNSDGTIKQVIASGMLNAISIAAAPNGLLYVSTRGTQVIFQVDPVAKTATPFISGVLTDGIAMAPDGKTLYAAEGGQIVGFDMATRTQVYTSGAIDGPDGLAVGAGPLAGNLYVNTTNGNVIQINMATGVQTFICTGGSRGDLVTIDPTDGALLLTQTDRILRLTPVAGGFGVQPEVQVTASSPQSQVAPGKTVLISGHASTTGNAPASPIFHGGFVPSTTMRLTAAGIAGGYTLSNFATGFSFSAAGPIGWARLPNGNVMVSDVGGNVRIFPNDNDGQTTAGAVIAQNYGANNGDGIVQVNGHIYMALQGTGIVIEVNQDGTFKQDIIDRSTIILGPVTGLTAGPNGHLYASNLFGTIYDIDPIAKVAVPFVNAAADGVAVSPDGATLYAKAGSDILGFDIATKAQVFDSGSIAGSPDGMAIGVGALAGNIFVNCNDGSLVQVNIATKAQTLLATSGSRGDLVSIDPSDGSLLLTQTDRILRLTPPPGGAFGNSTPATIKTVTVNGVPVDALDANGNFFAHVTVQPGQNNYAVSAIDSRGLSASVTLSISGVSTGSSTITPLVDLSGSLSPKFGRTSLSEATGVLYTQVGAVNTGQFAVSTPLFVGITRISDPTVTVLNPDGYTDTGMPYFNYSSLVTANHLEVGAQTGFRELSFSNPGKVQFTFDLVPLGQLNAPPQITSAPKIDAAAGQAYTYAVAASDPDSDPLTFSLLTAPSGMSINASTGLISFAPAAAAIGLQDVLVNVSDGRGGSAQQRYELNVTATLPNRPPVFTTTPVVNATAGHLYIYQAQAVDPDGDPVAYSLVIPSTDVTPRSIPIVNPGFEQQVLGDGQVTNGIEPGWTISGSAGDYNPPASSFPTIPEGQNVSFSNGSTISQVLNAVTIAGARYTLQAQVGWPLGLSFGGYAVQLWAGGVMLGQATSPVPTQGAFTTATVDVTIAANGPNIGKQLEIRLVGVGAQVEFDAVGLTMTPQQPPPEGVPVGASIDSHTGVLTWTPTAAQIGAPRVSIQADDGRGGITTQVFHLTVAADNAVPPANHAPIITSTPPALAYGFEGYGYRVRAVDPDNDPLTYSLVIGPAGMVIDPNTGVLTWPVRTLAFISNPVTVSVSDGRGGVTQQIFTVTEPFPSPSGNVLPTISSTPPIVAEANKLYAYQVIATTSDPAALTYSLTTAPAGMAIDPGTGLLLWTPTPADIGQTRQVVIAVTSSAGGQPATQSFGVTVFSQAPNHPPIITSTPPQAAIVGTLYRYDATGVDPDHDFLIWSLDKAPDGMGVDSSTGTIVWKPQAGQTGPQDVILHLSDGRGGELTQNFTINVSRGNRPPGITSPPPTSATIGSTYVYNVKAVDPDGDPISYALTNAPVGMTINPLTGMINWTPVLGTFSVVVEVIDTSGATADQFYSVVAQPSPLNKPPTITSTPPFTASPSLPYSYAVTATDPDGDPIHYALLRGPAGMTIDASSGVVAWTPTTGQIGAFAVSVAALDNSNASATQSFNIISGVNHAPVITSQPTTSVTAGRSYHYTVAATDADGDPLTFRLSTAPAGMTIDSFGNLAWSPAVGDVGPHPVQVLVADGRGGSGTQSFTVTVIADTGAPQVDIIVDQPSVNVRGLVHIRVATADDSGVVSRTLVVDGQAIALDVTGSADVRFTHAGIINLSATATDPSGNVGHAATTEQVIDPTDTSAPVVKITSPGDGGKITSLTDVIGTVTDPNLLFYTLSLAPADGSGDFHEFFRSTANVTNSKLGSVDPTLLANDTYILRLDAVNAGGKESEAKVEIEVMGNLKLGNFTLSFTDLTIPLGGLPITVGRTYDSLNANRSGDFGFGWNLDVGGTQLRTSLPPDPQSEIGVYSAFVPGTRVYISLPGGKREGFTFNPVQAPGLKGSYLDILVPKFEPDAGVTDTLTVDAADIFFDTKTGEFTDYYGSLPYNPADDNFGSGQYTLTTKSGVAYHIDGNTGQLSTLTDPLGTTLTFTNDGITSSRGSGVTFTRDPKGRITAITDPAGKSVNYSYDAGGNLIAVADRDANVTGFQYDSAHAHYLQKVIDPLGRNGIKSTYDAQGRLSQIIGAGGSPIALTFDSSSRAQTVTDALGNKTTTVYDTNGNPIQTLDAKGNLTVRTFDVAGNLLTETDPLGHTTTRTYDNRSNMLSVTDPLGHTTTYTYDNFGKPLTVVDPMGHTTVSTYDRGEITSKTTPTGDVFTAKYDAAGNRTSSTDGNGNTTSFTYAGTGFVTGIFMADGSGSLIGSNADGAVTSDDQFIVGPSGTVESKTTYDYDNSGNMTGETNAAGDFLGLAYDPLGRLSGSTDALGQPWAINYNADGVISSEVSPDGTTTAITYDADGRATTAKLGDGSIVRFEYDALGNRTKTIYGDGTFTAKTYDPAGRVDSSTALNGVVTHYTYDAAGEVLTETGPNNAVTSFTYDADGHQTSVTDALGGVTLYAYDAAGRTTTTTYPDGTFTTLGYDHNGNVNSLRDVTGAVWHYTYDLQGNLSSVTSPDGLLTSYVYDSNQRLVSVTDSAGHSTTFTYDVDGRRTARVLAGGAAETYQYNGDGTLAKLTDAAGISTTFTYNDQGKITSTVASNGESQTFTYDGTGHVTGVTASNGGTILAYDSVGHVTRWQGPDGNVLTYGYDAGGRLISFTTTAGTTSRTYDANGGIATVKGIDGGITTYTRDTGGRATAVTLPGGATETKTYDADSRTTQITDTGAGGQAVLSLTYTRDSAGRISKVQEASGRVEEYTYDIEGRVTLEKLTTPGSILRTIAYSYDAAGNLTSRIDSATGTATLTHNSDDQVTADGSATYTWDADGNLATRTEAGVTEHFTYDSQSRLIKMQRTGASSGPTVIEYQYDYDGLMSARIVDGVRTNFTWDRTSWAWPLLLEERSAAGNLLVRYEYGDGALQRSIDGAGVATLYATDSLGTVRAITSAGGTTLQSYTYDAYGRPLDAATASIKGPGYIGGWTDPVTGLIYLQNRWYSPRVASFIQRDPADPDPSNPRTLNRYAYGSGDPVNHMDPVGKFSLEELAVVTALIWVGEALSLPGSTVQSIFFGITNLFKAFKNADNPSAIVVPVVSATIPGGFADLLAATAGVEYLRFINSAPKKNAIYFYFGVGIGTPTAPGLSIGTLNPGIVYDTRNPDDYNGWFFSLSLSKGLTKALQSRIDLSSSESHGGSIFWSPTKTYSDLQAVDRYSHGFGAGAAFSLSENGSTENPLPYDFRLNFTYYILLEDF